MDALHGEYEGVGKMVIRLFEHWALSESDQLAALGLSDRDLAILAGYRCGVPMVDQETLKRAGHLLGIHKNLRTLFPENRDLAYQWISRPNVAFGGRSPITAIREDGLTGLSEIKRYVEQQVGY